METLTFPPRQEISAYTKYSLFPPQPSLTAFHSSLSLISSFSSHFVSQSQSLSCVRLFVTPWTAACQASLSITNSWSLLKLMSIESVMCPTISFVVPFFSHLQSFPASGSFQMSQFFASGGQSIGVSASTWVLPMSSQDWFPFTNPLCSK